MAWCSYVIAPNNAVEESTIRGRNWQQDRAALDLLLLSLIHCFCCFCRVSFRRNKNKEAKEEKKDAKAAPKDDVSL